MIAEVEPIWKDETCVIIAGGSSLLTNSMKDLKMLQEQYPRMYAITINDSWRLWPVNSINYFCDKKWWDYQQAVNPRSGVLSGESRSFHDMIYKGNWYTVSPDFTDHPQVKQLQTTGTRGLEVNPRALRTGSNAGYQAINLAYHLGAKRMLLLGYDMKLADNGRTHWHLESRITQGEFKQALELSMLPHFDSIAKELEEQDIEVINCSPDSDLECFEKMSLSEALLL